MAHRKSSPWTSKAEAPNSGKARQILVSCHRILRVQNNGPSCFSLRRAHRRVESSQKFSNYRTYSREPGHLVRTDPPPARQKTQSRLDKWTGHTRMIAGHRIDQSRATLCAPTAYL